MFNIDKSKYKEYSFNKIAFNISERVEPQQTDLDIYIGLEHLDPDSIHITRHGIPSDVEGTKLKAYKGDVIFGKRRAYQRKAGIVDQDCICSAHAMVLRANPEVILPELFPFFLHSDRFMNRAIDISEGSLSPTIKWKTLAAQKFLLPPKDKQKDLVEILINGIRLSNMLEILINSIRKYRLAYFENIIFGCDSNATIGNVVKFIKKISTPPHKINDYIALENISSSKFEPNEYTSSASVQSNCFNFTNGQILYGKLRSYLDKAVLVKKAGICSTELLVMQPLIDPIFLLQLLHSSNFLSYAKSNEYGTKMPRVSESIISRYEFYLPDSPEKDNITNKIKKLLGVENIVNKNIQNQKTLNKRLTSEIFS